MTKKTEKTETENKAPTPIAEVLIATGMQLGSEQGLKLGELVGHFEIAKIEVYKRITDSALAAEGSVIPDEISEPSEGGDKEDAVVAFEAEVEDTVEK